ncbi:MAG: hypothetical protein V4572_07135 [Bacteroidota bacterium]
MKKIFITVFLTLLGLNSFSQNLTVEEFQKDAELAGLKFEMPIGYKITEVKKNRDLQYSFAIINEDGSMEVRYSLFPMKENLAEYEKSKDDKNVIMINPNAMYTSLMVANGMNMTNGKMPEIKNFNTNSVKKEFNADYGGVTTFDFNCEFGKGYKIGQFVCLHKENVADVIITFLSNDINKHYELFKIPFHSLTFK